MTSILSDNRLAVLFDSYTVLQKVRADLPQANANTVSKVLDVVVHLIRAQEERPTDTEFPFDKLYPA